MYGTTENVYEAILGEGKIDFAKRSLPSIPTENNNSSYNNSALQQYANQEPIYAAILKKSQANQVDSPVRSKIQVADPVYFNTSGYDAVDAWLEQDSKIGSSSSAEADKTSSVIAMYENIEQPEAHYENNEEALRTLVRTSIEVSSLEIYCESLWVKELLIIIINSIAYFCRGVRFNL
jgi:hypothetical protein